MNDKDRDLMSCYVGEFSSLRTLVEEHIKQGQEFRTELREDIKALEKTLRGNGGQGVCSRMDALESRVKWLWGMVTAAILAVIGTIIGKGGG